MTYDLKCPVDVLSCTLSEFLADILKAAKRKQFLVFGEADTWIQSILAIEGFSGLKIQRTPVKSCDTLPGFKRVVAHVGPDERIAETLDGYWTPIVTVKQIFNQFGGSFDLIAALNTGKDRLIWWTPQVQAALPLVYVLYDDGHQEDVIERSWDMGYKSFLVEDCLVMVRSDAS